MRSSPPTTGCSAEPVIPSTWEISTTSAPQRSPPPQSAVWTPGLCPISCFSISHRLAPPVSSMPAAPSPSVVSCRAADTGQIADIATTPCNTRAAARPLWREGNREGEARDPGRGERGGAPAVCLSVPTLNLEAEMRIFAMATVRTHMRATLTMMRHRRTSSSLVAMPGGGPFFSILYEE